MMVSRKNEMLFNHENGESQKQKLLIQLEQDKSTVNNALEYLQDELKQVTGIDDETAIKKIVNNAEGIVDAINSVKFTDQDTEQELKKTLKKQKKIVNKMKKQIRRIEERITVKQKFSFEDAADVKLTNNAQNAADDNLGEQEPGLEIDDEDGFDLSLDEDDLLDAKHDNELRGVEDEQVIAINTESELVDDKTLLEGKEKRDEIEREAVERVSADEEMYEKFKKIDHDSQKNVEQFWNEVAISLREEHPMDIEGVPQLVEVVKNNFNIRKKQENKSIIEDKIEREIIDDIIAQSQLFYENLNVENIWDGYDEEQQKVIVAEFTIDFIKSAIEMVDADFAENYMTEQDVKNIFNEVTSQ